MDFMTSVKTCLSKWSDFSGKPGLAEFWWFFLASIILSCVFGFIPVIGWILSIALIVPSLAVGARRLHDTGRSGWLQLLLLIPIIGFIILVFFWIQKK